MVSSTVADKMNDPPTIRVSASLGVPSGNYRLVGWDMDATGKRLVDEICQIALYTPRSEFAQYVMPFKNMSPPAKKRHHLKVVTMGRYRVLKNSFTNKVLKTKSEISALTDFLAWLEAIKGDATDGVILVHHEPRRVNPSMLIEALTKYKLLERFKQSVKGFANGFDIARVKCCSSLKVFSLRNMARVILDNEEELSSATHRARLALQVVQHLMADEENGKVAEEIGSGDSDATNKLTVEFIREFVQSVDAEEEDYATLKIILARQNSLKPIFGPLLNSMARRKRQHASPLRRLLAESAIDYDQLQEAWANGKREGLEKLIKEKVMEGNKHIDDLLEVLECHFDPEKKPPPSTDEEKKNLKKHKFEKKKNGHGPSGMESPDTTTCHSPDKVKTVVEEEEEEEGEAESASNEERATGDCSSD